MRLYTKATLPDIMHETYGAGSAVECACTATVVLSYLARGNAEILPNASKEVMTLLAKAQWKAASEKEMASLKNTKLYTLLPVNSLSTGHTTIVQTLVYKVTADNWHKRHPVVLGRGKFSGIRCGSTFAPVCRLQSIVISEEYNI